MTRSEPTRSKQRILRTSPAAAPCDTFPFLGDLAGRHPTACWASPALFFLGLQLRGLWILPHCCRDMELRAERQNKESMRKSIVISIQHGSTEKKEKKKKSKWYQNHNYSSVICHCKANIIISPIQAAWGTSSAKPGPCAALHSLWGCV